MAFQVSPGINISEIDLTTVVPQVATTVGAIAGEFSWGPINTPILISSEDELVQRFGRPNASNYETFFAAANFLSYANALYVCRAATVNDSDSTSSTFSAVTNTASFASRSAHTILSMEDYDTKKDGFSNTVQYIARTPGEGGNGLKISEIDHPVQYLKQIDLANSTFASIDTSVQVPESTSYGINVGSNTIYINVANSATLSAANTEAFLNGLKDAFSVGDIIKVGNTQIGTQDLKVTSVGTATLVSNGDYRLSIGVNDVFKLSTNFLEASPTIEVYWEYYNSVTRAPGTSAFAASKGSSVIDEISVVVVDELGKVTGIPGTVLEVYENLSRATDAKSVDGATLFYKDVINNTSKYIWTATERNVATPAAPIANLSNSVYSTNTAGKAYTATFANGKDGDVNLNGLSTVTFQSLALAWDKFKDTETYDISLLIAGKPSGTNSTQLANYLIDNIAEVRKDCVVYISPPAYNNAQDVVAFRNGLNSTSYAVLDSGYKYQYDKYNDVYRWVPLCGDIAGVTARTDDVRDPWFSPAGFARGTIKNVIKLYWNPDKAARDLLYKNAINPVVTFPGQGTVLYGDKTLLTNPSAFDRINVRRLFITLEKAIATAAQSTLFEFNDEFTRAQFKNLIEPFLRDVQGRRGIYDYRVVCDETNNTSEVIDSNRFVGDIYIKPAKSINFIQLNFVAVRSGVEFNEVVGRF